MDWHMISESMHERGYAVLPKVLSTVDCDHLKASFDVENNFRKTVIMERYRFGLGQYKYFQYPLPSIIQTLREDIYPSLAAIANTWMELLHIPSRYPDTLIELLAICHDAGQHKPTPLILKYGKGGFNTLHQDLYGDIFFPIQMVIFLDQAGVDYTGGEFVLTQQVPRAQSKAIVLQPNKGDILLFTSNFRPQKGSKGYYKAHMKHGVSEVLSGQRHTLGIIFHDALS